MDEIRTQKAMHYLYPAPIFLLLLTLAALCQFPGNGNAEEHLFIGSGSDGVYSSRFDDGKLEAPRKVLPMETGAGVKLGPKNEVLYISKRTAERDGTGELIAAEILPEGGLRVMNRIPMKVDHFCSMAVSHDRRILLGASFGRGVVSSYLLKEDGSIGEPVTHLALPRFPKGKSDLARAHDVEFNHDGSLAFVPDISNNRVYTLDVNDRGVLIRRSEATSDSFEGPRHLTLNEENTRLYVLNQKGSSIVAFDHDEKGKLTEFQSIPTIPEDYDGQQNHSAEILIHPSGKFIYASNRNHDSLAVYKIDSRGKLTQVQSISSGGASPWSFVFDESGRFIICSNRKSNNLVVFGVDLFSGKLNKLDNDASVNDPVSLAR